VVALLTAVRTDLQQRAAHSLDKSPSPGFAHQMAAAPRTLLLLARMYEVHKGPQNKRKVSNLLRGRMQGNTANSVTKPLFLGYPCRLAANERKPLRISEVFHKNTPVWVPSPSSTPRPHLFSLRVILRLRLTPLRFRGVTGPKHPLFSNTYKPLGGDAFACASIQKLRGITPRGWAEPNDFC